MEKKGMLILAQADHLTGEEIGFAMDQIMSWGAYNVYAFSGCTKKNRTGQVLLIDADPEKETKWAKLLSEQFSIYGYHRLDSVHFCSNSHVENRKIVIRKETSHLDLEIRIKKPDKNGSPGRIEHADLVNVREQVHTQLGENLSLSKLRGKIESLLHADNHQPAELSL